MLRFGDFWGVRVLGFRGLGFSGSGAGGGGVVILWVLRVQWFNVQS